MGDGSLLVMHRLASKQTTVVRENAARLHQFTCDIWHSACALFAELEQPSCAFSWGALRHIGWVAQRPKHGHEVHFVLAVTNQNPSYFS